MTADRRITLGNTTYQGEGVPEFVSVQLADGTIRTESTTAPDSGNPLGRVLKVTEEIIDKFRELGVPIPCTDTCATHRCHNFCTRTEGHAADFMSHVCAGCANAMAGAQL